jgi:anti-sigma regulatory factor (Ser/Thr protein kinase)/CheY-like chemotaxis protein
VTTPCGSAGAPVQQKTALVVPSGGDVDELLTGVLASDGWSICRAVDNHQALAMATTEPFDMIITGRESLGPGDVEVFRKTRSSRPHVRLIILTDKWTPGDVISAMRSGAFTYFSAPFQAAELTEMVRAAMTSPCWDNGIEVLSATPTWVHVLARCDIATADRLVQFLRGIRDPDFTEGIISAFKEILLNAMEHGGNFDPKQHVEISFVRGRRAVACRIKDPGQGFSLKDVRHAAINSPADDLLSHVAVREAQGLRPGGFGLLLAKKFVDEVIYSEQGNEVLLIKYVDPAVSQVA